MLIFCIQTVHDVKTRLSCLDLAFWNPSNSLDRLSHGPREGALFF